MDSLFFLLDFCGYIYYYINVDTIERSEYMSPRTGRPTDDPKKLSTRIRFSENDLKMLEICCDKTGMKKSEVIRLGIQKVYEEINK